MEIVILGSGNAFSFKSYNTCFLLKEDDKNLVIDCGSRFPWALRALNIVPKDIQAIYISHCHADHIGGLEEMAFLRYDWVNKPHRWDQGPTLYAPLLIGDADLLMTAWHHSLRGGMETHDFQATLDTFFQTWPICKDAGPIPGQFDWMSWNFKLIQNLHAEGNNKYSFGLFATRPNYPSAYFTTDSRFDDSPEKIELYRKADRIFQDCECTPYISGAHANYQQLVNLPDDIKKKMYLCHYQDDMLDENGDLKYQLCAEFDGFIGFVEPGEKWTLAEGNNK